MTQERFSTTQVPEEKSPAAMRMTLQPGSEIVPGYTLVRQLGEGGFGQVWQARAPGDFAVALKFIPLNTDKARPELRALQILRYVRHPHLLDVQWAAPIGGFVVIAMPLCDQSLHDRLVQCQKAGLPGIPRAELLGYMTEVARALDFLNERRHPGPDSQPVGIQHRDIKPRNIFLVGGAARVADFGLAKVLARSVSEHSGSMTLHYAPPEFFVQEVAATSDQYSLAVTYCETRTGRLPFEGSIHSLIYAILQREPDLDSLTPEERPIVARALAKDPKARWTSCREFVERLAGAAVATAPSATACLDVLAVDVRIRTLQLLEASSPAGLTWAPTGTTNHILWHAGHALWVQDALCVQIITGKSELPSGWEEMFGMGSEPGEHTGPWPDRKEVARHLREQLPRLTQLMTALDEADLAALPPFAHRGDKRTLGQCVLHGLHDEANHQGEMYLLLKMQRGMSTRS